MSKITASIDFDRIKPEDLSKFLSLYAEQVSQVVNGGLDFATNFSAKPISVTFSSANSDVAVAHGLNRVPTGYLVTGLTAGMIVYNGSAANTNRVINLRSSAVGTATVLVY